PILHSLIFCSSLFIWVGCSTPRPEASLDSGNLHPLSKELASALTTNMTILPGRVAVAGKSAAGEQTVADDLRTVLRNHDLRWQVVRLEDEGETIRDDPSRFAALVTLDGERQPWSTAEVPLFPVVDAENLDDYTESVYFANALVEYSVRNLTAILKGVDFDPSIFKGAEFQKLAKQRFDILRDEHGHSEKQPDFATVTFQRMRSSRLIRIRAESPDPLVEALSANAAAEASEIYHQLEHRKNAETFEEILDTQRAKVKKEQDELDAFQSEHSDKTVEAQRLERDVRVAESILQSLKSRAEQSQEDADENLVSLQIVERAVSRPTSPQHRFKPGITALVLRSLPRKPSEESLYQIIRKADLNPPRSPRGVKPSR
ncbi:MAG: hypothetical protein PF795_11430, partial [Kiritimatiellae bacterium]|nr:hypothetical protein [Kiritimatiellia bacterium]